MTDGLNKNKLPRRTPARTVFPFTALVGQDEMKLALLLNVIAPSIGGVLIMGHRGTGKSTAVRALADVLTPLNVARECLFNCDPDDSPNLCDACFQQLNSDGKLAKTRQPVPFVDLPLGATEDRVCGSIDIERALRDGVKSFEPGLLARANRGFLYIDEVNLLEDHLVDLLLDVAVTGRNTVEREGISLEHPARFVLVGSGNPEEGELRPQLLDRFGLSTDVQTVLDLDERIAIVERREDFEREPDGFIKLYEPQQAKLRRQLERARRSFSQVKISRELLRHIAELCIRLKVDGHRGELTIARAARAHAAFDGRKTATSEDVRRVAAMSLRHRLRRDPLEGTHGGARVEDEVNDLFGADAAGSEKENVQISNQPEPSDPDTSGGKTLSGRHEKKDKDGQETEKRPGDKTKRRASEERVVPPVEASLPDETVESVASRERKLMRAEGVTRRGRRKNDARDLRRGRYTRATIQKTRAGVVAIDATLRAAASSSRIEHRTAMVSDRTGVHITSEDLRFKSFSGKTGTLYILAVDVSGSMAVNRINQAKGALAHLLRRSYINRDRVALVSFREHAAELLLAPSKSPGRAKKLLDALPVGGATPLAAGLMRALEVARRAGAENSPHIVLVIFTDGRANVALADGASGKQLSGKKYLHDEIEKAGDALRRAGVSSIVIDTQNRFTSGGEGQLLADALGGRYLFLPLSITAQSITEAFRQA